jgi:hypothetical protein
MCPETQQYGNLCMNRNEVQVLYDLLTYCIQNVEFEGRRESQTASTFHSHIANMLSEIQEQPTPTDQQNDDPLVRYRNMAHDFDFDPPRWMDDSEDLYDEDEMDR